MTPEQAGVHELALAVARLEGELRGHQKLCDGRWRVIWKLAGLMSGAVALAVSLAVTYLRP